MSRGLTRVMWALVVWISAGHPSATATQPRAPEAVQLLPNGDFEQGPVIWTQFSTRGLPLIRHLSEVGVTARSGLWGAVLGMWNEETAYIEQQVQVPVDAISVNYWYQVGSVDTHLGFDFVWIIINGSDIIDEFHLHDDENTTIWTLRTADISAYAGQTVSLRIMAEIDIVEESTIWIDDVFFESGGTPPPIFQDGFESGDTSAWTAAIP